MSAPDTIELLCCEAEGCGWTQLSRLEADPETGQTRALCGHIGTGRRITFVNTEAFALRKSECGHLQLPPAPDDLHGEILTCLCRTCGRPLWWQVDRWRYL
jgi:hypothetical protein